MACKAEELFGSCDGYVPPFWEIAKAIPGLEQPDGQVTVSSRFIRFIISQLVSALSFDENAYAQEYQDVAAAAKAGNVKSLHQHFYQTGYFEGRAARGKFVDAQWYLEQYPDLADAFSNRKPADAVRHFNMHGQFEGRVGSAIQEEQRHRWWAELEEITGS